MQARSDSTTKADATVLVSLGAGFDGALASVVYEARKLADPYASANTPIKEASDSVKPLWREEWADGLGYCKIIRATARTQANTSRYMECFRARDY
jgi:hypothetical protein